MKPGPLGAESYSQDQRGLQEAQLCVERDNPRSMRNSCHPGYFEDWVLDRGRLSTPKEPRPKAVSKNVLFICLLGKQNFFPANSLFQQNFFPFYQGIPDNDCIPSCRESLIPY